MGVPRLFKFLYDNYSDAIKYFNGGDFKINVDHLYIDANAILHPCAQKVFNYGSFVFDNSKYEKLSYSTKLYVVFRKFINTIKAYSKIVIPTKTLYIALDGCAPVAKQIQQRQRRYKSEIHNGFDSNCMTPGTIFMNKLTKFLELAIRQELQNNPNWRDLKIILSDPYTPGEGEHKILKRIKNSCPNDTHCIYSPDSDLLVLSLITQLEHILIFRDNPYERNMFYITFASKLRPLLASAMGCGNDNIYRSMCDFALMTFIVGNDFLPKTQMFALLEHGLELMLRVYRENDLRWLCDGDQINIINFNRLIAIIASYEHEYLKQNVLFKLEHPLFINHTLLRCVYAEVSDEVSEDNSSLISYNVDYEQFRQEYYNKVLKKNTFTEHDVKIFCQEYIKGLSWNLRYYLSECPSYWWYYPYYYAPLLSDLAKFMAIDVISFDFNAKINNNPIPLPFQQLIMVLPPHSQKMLPFPFHKVHNDDKLKKYYPQRSNTVSCSNDIVIDYEGKHAEFEGIVVLPFIDPQVLSDTYRSYCKTVKKNFNTNAFGPETMFYRDPSISYTYRGAYGKVNNCCIKTVVIH